MPSCDAAFRIGLVGTESADRLLEMPLWAVLDDERFLEFLRRGAGGSAGWR